MQIPDRFGRRIKETLDDIEVMKVEEQEEEKVLLRQREMCDALHTLHPKP